MILKRFQVFLKTEWSFLTCPWRRNPMTPELSEVPRWRRSWRSWSAGASSGRPLHRSHGGKGLREREGQESHKAVSSLASRWRREDDLPAQFDGLPRSSGCRSPRILPGCFPQQWKHLVTTKTDFIKLKSFGFACIHQYFYRVSRFGCMTSLHSISRENKTAIPYTTLSLFCFLCIYALNIVKWAKMHI